jgi:hypothetical protein
MVFGEGKRRRYSAIIVMVCLTVAGTGALVAGGCGPSPEVLAAQKAEEEYKQRFLAAAQGFFTVYFDLLDGLGKKRSFDDISMGMAAKCFQCVRDLDALTPPAKYAEIHREMRTLFALIGGDLRDSTLARRNGDRATRDRVEAYYKPQIEAAFVRVKAAIERGRAAERNREADFWEKVGGASRAKI